MAAYQNALTAKNVQNMMIPRAKRDARFVYAATNSGLSVEMPMVLTHP